MLTWATLVLRLVAIAGMCAGALADARPAAPSATLRRGLIGVTAATIVVAAGLATAADAWLSTPIDAFVQPA